MSKVQRQDGTCWVILGASSALARAFAHKVAGLGADVIVAGRDLDDLSATAADLKIRYGVDSHVLSFDAADTASHDGAVARITELATKPISVFLAFAVMPTQDEIDADPDKAVVTTQTGYVGAVSILHRLAPVLETQGEGRVIGIGSVAGDRGRLKNYVYGSAKAGLHTYLQGLRARLYAKNVMVTTIKPGFVDTPMTWGDKGPIPIASPDAAATQILKVSDKGKGSAYVPGFWFFILTIVRFIPEKILWRLPI